MLATQCFRGRGSYNNLRMLWLASNQGKQNKVIKWNKMEIWRSQSLALRSGSFPTGLILNWQSLPKVEGSSPPPDSGKEKREAW